MIFVKGTELAREKDGIIVGVTEEEFAKSLLYYAVSTVGSDNLEGILKGLLSGNGINLNVDIAKAQSCGNAKCNCNEKKTEILEEVSLDNSEMFLSQEDGASNTSLEEVVPLSDVDMEMMRESLIEAGELIVAAGVLTDKCPTVWSIMTDSKNQFNKNLMSGCDIKLQININNVTYSIVRNGGEDISPANNVVFYWDTADVIAVEEMFNLI